MSKLFQDEKSIFKLKLKVLALFCFLFAVLILLRAIQIQIVGDERLSKLEKKQFQSKVLVMPSRGMIFDRNDEPLAVNVDIQSLAANPSAIKEPEKYTWAIKKALGISYGSTLRKLKSNREFTWIKRHISKKSFDDLKKYQFFKKNGDLPEGFWIVKESQRVYPNNEIASHILGDVNVDLKGIEGIEYKFDEHLRGKVGSISAVKDALGRPTFLEEKENQKAQNGKPLKLTIDLALQHASERALEKAVAQSNAKGGTVIVMNAKDGEILAMANRPTFNPNNKNKKPSDRRNRVVTDGFEPGSTMKPILIASALEHGWNSKKLIWGELGQFKVQGRWISEAETDEKFKWLSLKKIIKVSSNVGAAKVALELGSKNYVETLHRLGFDSKTGIDFPGEISGIIQPAGKISNITLANMGFGQGLLVTPIQVLRAYAAIANGGWLIQPKLVLTEEFKNTDLPLRVLKPRTVEYVKDALMSTAEEGGTALKAKVQGYLVAGKTGTSQVVDPVTRRYSNSKYYSSFVGFLPNAEPNVVIFTSVDTPKGIYYASEKAAPLFKEVATAVINRYRMPMTEDLKDEVKTTLSQKEHIKMPHLPRIEQKENEIWKMPLLTGLTAREALEVFEGYPVEFQLKGFGVISEQEPKEGVLIKRNDKVSLKLIRPSLNEAQSTSKK